MKQLTVEQQQAVQEEWEEIHRWKPFLHWCRDWDHLLIDKGDPEFKFCNCYPRKRKNTVKGNRAPAARSGLKK